MKKIVIAFLMILALSAPCFAAFSSKGDIPDGAPVVYRGLKVTSEGVSVTLLNKGDKAVKFSAACAFTATNRRSGSVKELGDFFIDEVTLEPNVPMSLTKLYLKGDPELTKLAKKAESLSWTIYTLEEK